MVAQRPPIVARIADTVRSWLYPDPLLADWASSGGAPMVAHELYDPRKALSSMAAFPWIWACANLIATDLSGVPLVAVTIDPATGRVLKREREHPVLDLFRRSRRGTGGVAMRRQIYTDFALCQEASLRVIGTPGVDGIAYRLHPEDMEPYVDPATGLIDYFEWGGKRLPRDEVLWIRGIGWERGVRAARAESPIRSLENGLLASQEARKFARKAAKSGRVEFIIRPIDAVAQFGRSSVKAIKDMIVGARSDGTGVMILNRALDVTPISLSAREMEFSELDTRVRDEVLAVMGVPPVLVGLPGANYGTARQQSRTYWERRKHDAKLFDDEFSLLTGDPFVRIEHDFTDVEALQPTRTERLARVQQHVAMGMPVAAAYHFEGFHDAPVDESTQPISMRPPQVAPTVTEPQEDNGDQSRSAALQAVRSWQFGAAVRYQERVLSVDHGESLGAFALQEATTLCLDLINAGVPDGEAQRLSAHAAAIAQDSVSTIVDTSDADGVLGIRTLRVFGVEFARHLLGLTPESACP